MGGRDGSGFGELERFGAWKMLVGSFQGLDLRSASNFVSGHESPILDLPNLNLSPL